MKAHALKTWPSFFEQIARQAKLFEVRKADRDFAEGDDVFLWEWDPGLRRYTGRFMLLGIGYVLRGAPLPSDLVAFALVVSGPALGGINRCATPMQAPEGSLVGGPAFPVPPRERW